MMEEIEVTPFGIINYTNIEKSKLVQDLLKKENFNENVIKNKLYFTKLKHLIYDVLKRVDKNNSKEYKSLKSFAEQMNAKNKEMLVMDFVKFLHGKIQCFDQSTLPKGQKSCASAVPCAVGVECYGGGRQHSFNKGSMKKGRR